MKRIFLSVVTLMVALAVGSFATRAAWTDTVVINNNKIQTGTADLQVSSTNCFVGDHDNDAFTPDQFFCADLGFSNGPVASSMVIGDTIPLIPDGSTEQQYSFSVKNASNGAVNFTLAGDISFVDYTGSTFPDPTDESNLTIDLCEWDEAANTCSATVYTASLTAWQAGGVSIGTIDSGITKNYGFQAHLDNDASQDWQSQTVTFTLDVLGTFGI